MPIPMVWRLYKAKEGGEKNLGYLICSYWKCSGYVKPATYNRGQVNEKISVVRIGILNNFNANGRRMYKRFCEYAIVQPYDMKI